MTIRPIILSGGSSYPAAPGRRKECVRTAIQVALYARVSSEQQAAANTIERQLSEIRARSAADGFDLRRVLEFVDETRATVARR